MEKLEVVTWTGVTQLYDSNDHGFPVCTDRYDCRAFWWLYLDKLGFGDIQGDSYNLTTGDLPHTHIPSRFFPQQSPHSPLTSPSQCSPEPARACQAFRKLLR